MFTIILCNVLNKNYVTEDRNGFMGCVWRFNVYYAEIPVYELKRHGNGDENREVSFCVDVSERAGEYRTRDGWTGLVGKEIAIFIVMGMMD